MVFLLFFIFLTENHNSEKCWRKWCFKKMVRLVIFCFKSKINEKNSSVFTVKKTVCGCKFVAIEHRTGTKHYIMPNVQPFTAIYIICSPFLTPFYRSIPGKKHHNIQVIVQQRDIIIIIIIMTIT